jgi:outer membrane murein-binding lipoprotein Lpp
MAKAPLCKLCGYAHWSTQPHNRETSPVTLSRSRNNVTSTEVTSRAPKIDESNVTELKALRAEIAMAHEEIARLKKRLAEMSKSNAERQATYRERQREKQSG